MRSFNRSGVVFLFLAFTQVGCGQQWVKDINVEAFSDSQSDPHAKVTTHLEMGNITLPNVAFPIPHPKTGEILGEITLGGSQLNPNWEAVGIDLNIAKVATVQGCEGGAALPNGQELPVALADKNSVVCLPIPGPGIRIYVKLDLVADRALIGTAIPIKPMDSLGAKTGVSSFFNTFLIGNKVPGTFGLFMGPMPGENGLAFLFELDNLVKDFNIIPPAGALQTQVLAQQYEDSLPAEFQEVTPSYGHSRDIRNHLKKLDRDKAVFYLQ